MEGQRDTMCMAFSCKIHIAVYVSSGNVNYHIYVWKLKIDGYTTYRLAYTKLGFGN